MAKRLEILVETGELAGKRFEVPAYGLRLGRSSSNDIHIADEGLSRNHCLFECSGELDITVVDLASANGTFVNGEALDVNPRVLKINDEIQVGSTILKVVGEEAIAPTMQPTIVGGGKDVDLGFGPSANVGETAKDTAPSKGSSIAKIIMLILVGLLVGAIAYVLVCGNPLDKAKPKKAASVAKESDNIISFSYEKVEADSTRVFRYAAELSSAGELTVQFDDLPRENRRVPPAPKKISDSDMEILERIFANDLWGTFKSEYKGSSSGVENTLKLWRIKLVRKNGIKEVSVLNELEPEGFANIRSDLETWANNILGVQSIERSRDELEKSSLENETLGDEKWDKRDVQDRNLSDAIACYTLAKNDLTSLGANAQDIDRIQVKINKVKEELNIRYKQVRSEADRYKAIGDLDAAREEFAKIRAMIPSREDPRHREAEKNIELIELKRYEDESKGKRR